MSSTLSTLGFLMFALSACAVAAVMPRLALAATRRAAVRARLHWPAAWLPEHLPTWTWLASAAGAALYSLTLGIHAPGTVNAIVLLALFAVLTTVVITDGAWFYVPYEFTGALIVTAILASERDLVTAALFGAAVLGAGAILYGLIVSRRLHVRKMMLTDAILIMLPVVLFPNTVSVGLCFALIVALMLLASVLPFQVPRELRSTYGHNRTIIPFGVPAASAIMLTIAVQPLLP